MLTKLLLLPLVLHVFMILILGIRVLSARIRAVKNGQAKLHEVALDSTAWPRRVLQLGNNFNNQFDSPMLWYSLSALVVATHLEDMIFVAGSWMFLLTRFAHSLVHTGSNDVPSRMRIFLFGFAVLILMWLWFSIRLLIAL